MTEPLPDSWDDEAWPLDDPVPAPGLRPVNWSDTHADPPQVADLADEAWQYALDHGCSMEQALARLQQTEQLRRHWGRRSVSSAGTVDLTIKVDVEPFRQAMAKVADVFTRIDQDAIAKFAEKVKEISDQEAAEARKPRVCPRHGPMTAGGFCRRCARSP